MTVKARFQRGRDLLDVEFDTPEQLEIFLRLVRFGESNTPIDPSSLYPPQRVPQAAKGNSGDADPEMPNMEQVISWIRRFEDYRHTTSDLNRIFFPPDGLIPRDQKVAYNRFLRVLTKARERLASREGFKWQTEGKGKALSYSRQATEKPSD